MIAVKPSFAYDSTRFHTFSTEPQVVSTSTHPSARSRSKSCTVTPKAGRITTSSGLTAPKSNSPPPPPRGGGPPPPPPWRPPSRTPPPPPPLLPLRPVQELHPHRLELGVD